MAYLLYKLPDDLYYTTPMGKLNGKNVYVGMSGGVDSSVSAALLQEQGYDVTGVFIKVWQPDFIECTWKQDRLDAMRVAAQLGIPFVTLDLEQEYKQGVIDYMLREYKAGRTPNPDVMCNQEVKFGAFLSWARTRGADYIATGHYAQTDGTHLQVSKDTNKDQTYFLWKLDKERLAQVLFPIGHMVKDEVRKEARIRGLYTGDKKDSQGLCFVGTIDMTTLLKAYIPEQRGDVVDEAGQVIGSHDGVFFYTLGERHGFIVHQKHTQESPYFVVKKDIENNILVVSHAQPEKVLGDEIPLEDMSHVADALIPDHIYQARGRYRAPCAQVKIDGNIVKVVSGELVATPGQSLVLYDGDVCVGGGIMK